MRTAISILFLFAAMMSSCQTKLVTLTLTETHPYCGGAKPTAEIEEASKQKYPYSNRTVYLYNKKNKCVDSLVTNDKGEISKKIAIGTYKVFEKWKHIKSVPEGNMSDYDQNCLKAEWAKPDAVLTVTSKSTKLDNKTIGETKCFWQQNCLINKIMPPEAPRPH